MVEKVKRYFEEHPVTKEKVITAAKIGGEIAGCVIVCYVLTKVGKSACSKMDISKIPEPKIEVPKVDVTSAINDVIPTVPDDHSFDMIFKDLETGDSYTFKNSCLGSYVNDILSSFGTEIELSIDKVAVVE